MFFKINIECGRTQKQAGVVFALFKLSTQLLNTISVQRKIT
jgi:hypothetical protein